MGFVDSRHSEIHEYDRLTDGSRHLQHVLDGRLRLLTYVHFHVLFHRDPTEGAPGNHIVVLAILSGNWHVHN